MNEDRSFPTMIIPSGTEITVNEHGELAIRTPGNLVIQNSGAYSVIECGGGSLRIDPDVRVEAASVKAADTCYVAGSLTAWRVKAKKVVLEKGSQAFIMLRESETLDLDRQARLVGNFGSEKELYLLLGRFNDQLRHLPQALSAGEPSPARNEGLLADATEAVENPAVASEYEPATSAQDYSPDAFAGSELPDAAAAGPFGGDGSVSETLDSPEPEHGSPSAEMGGPQERADAEALLQIVAQRELLRSELSSTSREALNQVLQVLRAGNPESVEAMVPGLLARVENPSAELMRLRSRLARVLVTAPTASQGE